MPNFIDYYLSLAAETAISKDDRRGFYLGAVAIRGDGAIVKAINGPAVDKMPPAHAEARCARKLDHGAVVFVARVKAMDGSYGIAKPCENCLNALKSRRVKKVYYTTGNKEMPYGCIDL